jgi:cell division protein FtsI/penicillin-binding protein 2
LTTTPRDVRAVFETRLKVLLAVLAIALAVIVARLVELQVLDAEQYRRRAKAVLLLAPKALPFVRGRILDRFGNLLASDEPSWDVCVDYHILDPDSQDKDVSPEVLDEIDEMWADLVRFSGLTRAELGERVQSIVERVERIQEAVKQRRGFDVTVREEKTGHPVLTNLDDQAQVAARPSCWTLRPARCWRWCRIPRTIQIGFRNSTPRCYRIPAGCRCDFARSRTVMRRVRSSSR